MLYCSKLGLKVADMGDTGASVAKNGPSLKSLSKGQDVAEAAPISNATRRVASESGSSSIKSSELVFGSSTKSTQKLMNQMKNRGWTEDLIRNTVDNPYTSRASTNKATVFYTQQGSYVIVDNITKEIVQISDNINPST